MLQNTKQLYGKRLGATDGDIGRVEDFYFDDLTWAIRYLVVDTGQWLSGRPVLLSPHAFESGRFGQSERDSATIPVNLTRAQIEKSPSIDTHLPVSRQYEVDYHRHFGWPGYWQDASTWGVVGSPVVVTESVALDPASLPPSQANDPHLRSTKSVAGHKIEATDGPVGTVNSFMVDDKSWEIRELVVTTGNWFSGRNVLVLPENVLRISYEESTVYVNLSRENMTQALDNDVVQAVETET